jgi:L-rhamnose isomerase/sugar isomerase
MAVHFARAAGPQAKVLVDPGHHYAAQNIEQIVAWLLDEGRLGGLHFNDRRYADDDLTLGSIDPYQAFRIFHEILISRVAGRRARTSHSPSTRAII